MRLTSHLASWGDHYTTADEIAFLDGLASRGRWNVLRNYGAVILEDRRHYDGMPVDADAVKDRVRVLLGRV